MKLFQILERLGEKEFDLSQTADRRETIFSIGKSGKAFLKAALPLGVLASLDASAQSGNTKRTASIVDVLNFALTLEHLEYTYYNFAIGAGVIVAADLPVFTQIRKHELAHVNFLQTTITSLGGTPDPAPNFDFTAGGQFNPFVSYGDFLALAQAFEDTGVRAYKGQAGNLMANDTVLTAALQIHSVEARHAAEVRRLRAKNGFDVSNKAWIENSNRGTMPAATQPVYNGENNTIQGGVDATTVTTATAQSVTEAFDEPLTDAQVLAIANLFIL